MAISKFTKGLFSKGGTYECANCKHVTRNVGGDEASCGLCLLCYDEAGLENAHNDGHHAEESDQTCHYCNPKVKTVIQQREEDKANANLTDAIKLRFLDLSSQLSPENLSCDGELPRHKIAARRAAILKEWKSLEAQVGRKVGEEEPFTWKIKTTSGKPETSPAPANLPEGKERQMATKNTAAQAKSEIKKLLKKLESLAKKSDSEGRAIRRMLRKLGHKGGLRGTKK